MWHKCYAVARLNYPSNVTFSIIVNGAPQKKNSRIIHFMGKLLVQLWICQPLCEHVYVVYIGLLKPTGPEELDSPEAY